MSLSSFLKLVEIQTKVASVVPFLLGTTFVLYKFDNFNLKNAVLFFLSMIIFDMTTTAINNYMDHKKALKKEGYGYEEHNAIVRDGLKIGTVKWTIIFMLILASILGVVLVFNTNIVVLAFGVVCFFIGVVYSYGPIPISRTPFGEIFSGLTMGFAITFLSVYIHIFEENQILTSIKNGVLTLDINLEVILSIFLISIPAIAGISNIMLANNICDIEDDIENKRYTLPIFIGKEMALKVFRWTYYLAFLSIALGVILKVIPIVSIIALITLKKILENLKTFDNLQSKRDTFVLSVQNFLMINVVYILTLALGIILKNIL